MAGMVAALIYTGVAVLTRRRRAQRTTSAWMRWGTPVLAVAGLIVAGYLAYVETQGIPAVCVWCLASAAIVTLILRASVGPAIRAIEAH